MLMGSLLNLAGKGFINMKQRKREGFFLGEWGVKIGARGKGRESLVRVKQTRGPFKKGWESRKLANAWGPRITNGNWSNVKTRGKKP